MEESIIVFVVGACFIGSQVQKAITPTSSLSASVTETIKTDAPNTDQPARPTQKPASAVKTFAHFEDGVYIVGKDITPGTYRTRSGSDSCYYERLSGFGNTIGNIIAIENTDDPAIVTIAATDKGFKSTRCGTWTKDLSRITSSKTTFEDGMYIVGTDIEPGTYKSDGESSCYYERLSNFGNASGAIIAIENTDGPAIVTIAATDKGFKSTRCGTWKRI